MPTVHANGINIYYESTGQGEPLILIPYLAADQACYAFQVADYAKHFTCISVDLRGAGQSDKPHGKYTTDLFAEDVAAFMQAIKVDRAHVMGVSLGAAVGMHLAAKHPERVKTLSLHSSWPKTDPFLKTAVEGWQAIAKGLGSVPEMVILGIFPWCFTPGLYAEKPDYVKSLADFVRSRPVQPLDAFMRESDAVINHDASAVIGRIKAPTQITFGRFDMVTSTRFAPELQGKIEGSEVHVFEDCAHAAIYENVAGFNQATLAFLNKHTG
ncbi:MAG TPA: alpha/beta hydrolase [Candidatus Dormibacteraeota bacterium]|nr:alpha/beta hydrolase [Candidatus Dormibacteraeota bacterium]